MNKLRTSLLASAFLLAHSSYGQITNPAPYCIAGYDDVNGDIPHFISNVTLGSLDNTSGDTQFAAPHYVFYNNITAPELSVGNTYSLSVTHDPQPSTLHYVAVYIDYNHNNSFDDTGEKVLQQTIMAQTITNPSVASITIPATATPGITRMRVMAFEDDMYSSTHPNATPCTADSLDWGETEDYNVNITLTTGISPISKDNSTFLYPNPAKDVIYVDKNFLGGEMTIADLQGWVTLQNKITNTSVNIASLISGVYFVKIINNGLVSTQVLIVGK